MKTVLTSLSQLLKSLRVVAIVGFCALLLLTSASPAFAFGIGNSSPDPSASASDPTEGTDFLKGIRQESEDSLKGGPRKEDTIRKANEGLNGVQGAADFEKMDRGSSQATSVEKEVQDALESITGKK